MMPKPSAPPRLPMLSVLLSTPASITPYRLEISRRLFWSKGSRRCARAPWGVDESALTSHTGSSWQLPARGSRRQKLGQTPPQKGLARGRALPATEEKHHSPCVIKIILPNAPYLYSGVFFMPWRPGISVPHDSMNIFIGRACLHFVIFLSL